MRVCLCHEDRNTVGYCGREKIHANTERERERERERDAKLLAVNIKRDKES